MKLIIRKLLEWLLFIIIGFWIATTGLLEGTTVGSWMDTIIGYIPDLTEEVQLRTSTEKIESPVLSLPERSETNDLDFELLEEMVIDLTNELRVSVDVEPLESNEMLTVGANIRAYETAELFSHTRPDGSDAFTVMQEDGILYPYRMIGENLAMGTYIGSEEYMAELLFDGWVESEGHYNNMIQPEYREIGVGVHYDGEFLYLTQLFGVQHGQ